MVKMLYWFGHTVHHCCWFARSHRWCFVGRSQRSWSNRRLQLGHLHFQIVVPDCSPLVEVPMIVSTVKDRPKCEQTHLKGEILVWRHETDALKMIRLISRTLLLRKGRKWSATSALAFTYILAEGGAGSKCIGSLIVGLTKSRSCTGATKQSTPCIRVSKRRLCSTEQATTRCRVVVVVSIVGTSEPSKACIASCSCPTAKEPTSTRCRRCPKCWSILAKGRRIGGI